MEKIELGVKVRDKVTGFEGIVTARLEYLNGCVQYCVEPKVDKEGKMSKYHYIDVDQLEVMLNQDVERVKEKGIGGVMPNVPE